MIRRARSFVLVLLLLAGGAARADASIWCDGGIVSVGESKLDLLGKCGRPAFVESREEVLVVLDPALGAAAEREISFFIETWTYDFGPRKTVQLVRLEGGKVVDVARGERGHAMSEGRAPRVAASACDPFVLGAGLRELDVLAECGEPSAIDRRRERWVVWIDAGDGRRFARTRTRVLEVWSYDFGPRQLQRFLDVEDGQVVGVRTGGYGYGYGE